MNVNVIASFHTMPEEQKPFLIGAAKPQTRIIRKKVLIFIPTRRQVTDNTLREFLKTQAVEQEKYDHDCDGFCTLDVMLADGGNGLFDLALAPESEEMSNATGCRMALYDHDSAGGVLDLLRSYVINPETVRLHLADQEHPAGDVGQITAAIIGAHEISIRWFGNVEEDQLGLLMISAATRNALACACPRSSSSTYFGGSPVWTWPLC